MRYTREYISKNNSLPQDAKKPWMDLFDKIDAGDKVASLVLKKLEQAADAIIDKVRKDFYELD